MGLVPSNLADYVIGFTVFGFCLLCGAIIGLFATFVGMAALSKTRALKLITKEVNLLALAGLEGSAVVAQGVIDDAYNSANDVLDGIFDSGVARHVWSMMFGDGKRQPLSNDNYYQDSANDYKAKLKAVGYL